MVKTKSGRLQLRMTFDAGETVQVDAVLKAGKHTLASATFPPLAAGRRSLRWTLPAGDAPAVARLKLTVTDGFGNRAAIPRRVRIGQG